MSSIDLVMALWNSFWLDPAGAYGSYLAATGMPFVVLFCIGLFLGIGFKKPPRHLDAGFLFMVWVKWFVVGPPRLIWSLLVAGVERLDRKLAHRRRLRGGAPPPP